MTIFERVLCLESGPASVLPLVHVPLLKDAPREDNGYKVAADSLGDLCHFYGNFSGYHLYFIVTALRTRIVPGSLEYYDREKGLFSVELTMTLNDGRPYQTHISGCKTPLVQHTQDGAHPPTNITVEDFSPGTPDGLKFHFNGISAKFKFAHNLIPYIPDTIRCGDNSPFSLEIEYIGKAVGKNGAREVADRLGQGHSTESLILAELNHRRRNREAYAVMFKPGRLTDAKGNTDNSVSFNEIVDFMEKSLIASFQPIKNKQSLKFPNDGSDTALNLMHRGIKTIIATVESPADYGLLSSPYCLPTQKHSFSLEIPSRF